MNILFDYQAFELQTYGGVSRMFVELASKLNAMGNSCLVGVKESSNVHLQNFALTKDMKPARYRHDRVFGQKQSFKGEYRIKELLIKLTHYSIQPNVDYCIKLLKEQNFDIFHPTYFYSYFLPFLKDKPFVLTVHDMIPELFPEYFARDNFQIIQKKLLCPLATRIHVPSNKTKEDLVNILTVNPDKVCVIPHGYSKHVGELPDGDINPASHYILYVGQRYAYKNFTPFIHECAKAMHDYPELEVVCTGPDFTVEERKLFDRLHIGNKVKHVFANEGELARLYSNAIAFVYPSLYEGFGIPILEAFSNGCPVMLNEASCFPEVAGDAAVYFTLQDSKSDFYEKLTWLYRLSDEERQKLIDKGHKRLSLYSWEKSAQQLDQLYHSII